MDEQKTEEQINTEAAIKKHKEGSVGATVGSVIVILMILAGGYYFLSSLKEKVIDDESINEQGVSEEQSISEINAELDAMEFENFDAEMAEIEAEIDAAIEE